MVGMPYDLLVNGETMTRHGPFEPLRSRSPPYLCVTAATDHRLGFAQHQGVARALSSNRSSKS